MSLDLPEARRIVYAALAPGAGIDADEDPEQVAARAVAAGYTAGQLAGECGLAWPMPDELADMAYWSGLARWATLQRDRAVRAALAEGCPLRTAAQVTGLSHSGIVRIRDRG